MEKPKLQKDGVNSLPLAELVNLCPMQKPSREACHVTIAISGFLSEKDDHFEEWKNLIEY